MAGATALTKDINIVTINGNDDDGVALPTAVAGKEVMIINSDAAQRLQVWPGNGFSDTIDSGSANAVDANKLAAGAVRTYVADGSVNWVTSAVTVPAASATVAGIAELTTNVEAIAGTDTTRAVVSSALQAKTNKIGVHVYVVGAGSADVLTLTVVPAITTYVTGARFLFLPTADNTGACTLNVSGLGAKNIKKSDGAGALANPAAADLDQVLIADVIYDGTQFVLQNPGVAAGGLASGDIIVADDGAVGAPGITFDGDLDNGLYKIGTDTWGMAAAGAIVWSVTAAGFITRPKNPSFQGYGTDAGGLNATGDGTVVNPLPMPGTEVWDLAGNFGGGSGGTYLFTAPVAGQYIFWAVSAMAGLLPAHNLQQLYISSAGGSSQTVSYDDRTSYAADENPFTARRVHGGGTVILAASDTVRPIVSASGAAKVVDIGGSDYFTGWLP
jgi:hypothetical protein